MFRLVEQRMIDRAIVELLAHHLKRLVDLTRLELVERSLLMRCQIEQEFLGAYVQCSRVSDDGRARFPHSCLNHTGRVVHVDEEIFLVVSD